MFLLILAPSWCLSKSLKQSLPWSRELSVLSVNCSVQWEAPVPLGAVSVTLSPENKQEVQRELRGHLAADSICTLTSNQGARRDRSTRTRACACTTAGLGEAGRWGACLLHVSPSKSTQEGSTALVKGMWRSPPLGLRTVTQSAVLSGLR